MRLKLTSLLIITNLSEIQNTEIKTTIKNWETSLSQILLGIQSISRLRVAVLVTILEDTYLFFCLYCLHSFILYIYSIPVRH